MSSATPHRIDPPSSATARRRGPHFRGVAAAAVHAAAAGSTTDTGHGDSATASEQDWLRLHASDLVERLQSWAADLDAREAQLNARCSLQDHRERQFRLEQQDIATQMAEQQRSIERMRREIEARARRLAFESDRRAA